MSVYSKKERFGWLKHSFKIGFLVAAIAGLNVFSQPLRSTFFSSTASLSGALFSAGSQVSSGVQSFWNVRLLSQENSELAKENNRLLAQISTIEDQTRHQQIAISFTQNNPQFTALPAQVIGENLQVDTLMINKGSADGISQGMPVVGQGNAVYGKIERTYAHESVVLLLSSPESVVNVEIPQPDPSQQPVYGAVKGKGNLSVFLDLVDTQAQLHPGDNLVTSGLDGIFPADLPVGSIISPLKNNLHPFQQASVQPLFHPQQTDMVFIILNHL